MVPESAEMPFHISIVSRNAGGIELFKACQPCGYGRQFNAGIDRDGCRNANAKRREIQDHRRGQVPAELECLRHGSSPARERHTVNHNRWPNNCQATEPAKRWIDRSMWRRIGVSAVAIESCALSRPSTRRANPG